MKIILPALFLFFLTLPVWADEWSLVQETGASMQIQTVQADGYWGGTQSSYGLGWTLGLDWNRTLALRGGLTARAVQTSSVYQNTVYPGYQGWGWTLAADWFPFRTAVLGDSWAGGLTVGGTHEYLAYPGLYKSFVMEGVTVALAGEAVPGWLEGLAFRLRVPVGVDLRPDFRLSWRVGAEVSVVFRGGTAEGAGGQTP